MNACAILPQMNTIIVLEPHGYELGLHGTVKDDHFEHFNLQDYSKYYF